MGSAVPVPPDEPYALRNEEECGAVEVCSILRTSPCCQLEGATAYSRASHCAVGWSSRLRLLHGGESCAHIGMIRCGCRSLGAKRQLPYQGILH